MRSRPITGAPAARSVSCGSSEGICRFDDWFSLTIHARLKSRLLFPMKGDVDTKVGSCMPHTVVL